MMVQLNIQSHHDLFRIHVKENKKYLFLARSLFPNYFVLHILQSLQNKEQKHILAPIYVIIDSYTNSVVQFLHPKKQNSLRLKNTLPELSIYN